MHKVYKDELFLAVIQLADLAAEITSKYFRKQININYKSDKSPVTAADLEIERNLRGWIKQNYPTHSIIGEEYAKESNSNQYTWVIDPIDGTANFALGKPIFSTLVALLEDNNPVAGIIDQPIINERYVGVKGDGAWLNGKKMKTSSQEQIADARLNITSHLMFITNNEKNKFELLCNSVSLTSFGGDAYAYGLLADGHIDIILEANLKFYDIAAVKIIIEESGGVLTDWQGNEITLKNFNGQCLACANKVLHSKMLTLING
jgi:inositol-phosphate phosphatase/L-galactose 1-phosphate phosphatase/histidinol-phosphatase